MAIVYHAVYIDVANIARNDFDIGMYYGALRWVTGRPDYSTTGPTIHAGDAEPRDGTYFYNGIIADRGVGKSTISTGDLLYLTGGYKCSGAFEVEIVIADLADRLASIGLDMRGKEIRHYVIIDNVAYCRYIGSVTSVEETENGCKISSEINLQSKHIDVPKNTISESVYHGAEKNIIGNPIPICIGDINYAKMYNVKPAARQIPVITYEGGEYTYCAATAYDGDKSLTLSTFGKTFEVDDLKGKYLKAIKAPSSSGFLDDGNTEVMIKIAGNSRTVDISYAEYVKKETTITLEEQVFNLYKDSTTAFDNDTITAQTWLFEVWDISTSFVVSDGEAASLQPDANGDSVFYWDSDSAENVPIKTDSEISYEANSIIDVDTYKGVKSGDIITYKYASLESALYNGVERSALYDRDETTVGTEIEYTYVPLETNSYTVVYNYYLQLPSNLADVNFSRLYLVPDFDYYFNDATGSPSITIEAFKIYPYPYGGVDTEQSIISGYNVTKEPAIDGNNIEFRLLPERYFENAIAESERPFNIDGSSFEVDSSFVDEIKNNSASSRIMLRITLNASAVPVGPTPGVIPSSTSILYMREIGVVLENSVGAYDDTISARVSGEGVGANNVYGALKYMLETVEGKSAADIDYTNVAFNRLNWHVGGQIIDKKNNSNHISELCKNAYVAGTISRNGKIALSCWRDNMSDGTISHDSDLDILRGSVSKLENTDYTYIYNQFEIQHSKNAGDEYDRKIVVTGISQRSTFPAVDDVDTNGDLVWKQLVNGLSGYALARYLWDMCRESYQQYGTISVYDGSNAKLEWYIDTAIFDYNGANGLLAYSGDNASAVLFAKECCEWLTKQKDVVRYSVPLTAQNITLDNLQAVTFSDYIATANKERRGWITKIETGTDRIDVTLLLDEYDEPLPALSVQDDGTASDAYQDDGTAQNSYMG